MLQSNRSVGLLFNFYFEDKISSDEADVFFFPGTATQHTVNSMEMKAYHSDTRHERSTV